MKVLLSEENNLTHHGPIMVACFVLLTGPGPTFTLCISHCLDWVSSMGPPSLSLTER